MTTTAKGLLAGAFVCLAGGGIINTGWINPGNVDALYVLLPLGAVFLGLFLIVLVLGRENKAYDQEIQHAGGGRAVKDDPRQRAASAAGHATEDSPKQDSVR